jgi:hypothetical protein
MRKPANVAGVVIPVVALAGVITATQVSATPSGSSASQTDAYRLAHGAVTATGANAATADTAAVRAAQLRLAKRKVKVNRPKPSGRPSARPSATPSASPATLTCSGSSSPYLPANYAAIVAFLSTHGYTRMAAAGMAGNIYQESKGDPESVGTGGGGLIGWTPLPAGYVTGNVTADLQTQLNALLTYNQQWSQYIPALNAATTPTEAADIYMNDFERPGIPAAYNRESAAAAVAQACGIS